MVNNIPTPLGHSALIYSVYRLNNSLNLPACIVGSILPDLESIPSILSSIYPELQPFSRGLLHSFAGIPIVVILSILTVIFLYPTIVHLLFNVNYSEVKAVCKPSMNIALSSFIGVLSHVLIDSTCHKYNPLLYPFTLKSIDVYLISSNPLFYIFVEYVIILSFIAFNYNTLRKCSREEFFMKLLVK